MNMNKQHLTLLVLLDLSAAFDTLDLVILPNHLNSNFGISGCVLSWFRSYLDNRSQSVSVNGETSRSFDIKHGMPQGSSSFCMSVSYSLSWIIIKFPYNACFDWLKQCTLSEILKLINYSCCSYPTRASYSGQVNGFRTPNEKRVENTAVFEHPCLK